MQRTLLIVTAIIVALSGFGMSIRAQGPPNPTATRMIYHDGPVVTDTPYVFLIWYGCWSAACGNPDGEAAQSILNDFVSSLGSTPYFQINTTYPDGNGIAPNGHLIAAQTESDPLYLSGRDLTDADIRAIVRDRIGAGHLPLIQQGIYIVLGAPDVGSTATGLCAVGNPLPRGTDEWFFVREKYGFIGDPGRCPNVGAPQFVAPDGTLRPTPNGNFTADAMAAKIASLLNVVVTNPYGDGWYDRFGLENADKCEGRFGQTYTTANGARANVRLGQRDFLLQQNFINDRPGNRCALSQ